MPRSFIKPLIVAVMLCIAATFTVAAKPVISSEKTATLSIPTIGLSAPVVTVGTTAGNAIDVPAGPQVGHWSGSALPGQPGAAFLDGHVFGIFADLNKLAVGQTVSVTYGQQTFRYQVVHRETVALDTIDMRHVLSVYGDNSQGLNIMTCAGTYLPSADTYDQRLVIYTVRV